MNQPSTFTIRDCQPTDQVGASLICMKTGFHGGDADAAYAEDPGALGRIFTDPYVEFEPGLGLMLEDQQALCGYAVGAFDSRNFYDRYEREWRPNLIKQFPAPSGEASGWTRPQLAYHLYHHPKYFLPDDYEAFPSHLHINLLPRARRQGNGRRLLNELFSRLRKKGSPGVHLGVGSANKAAIHFYQSLGFQELSRTGQGEGHAVYMGLSLSETT